MQKKQKMKKFILYTFYAVHFILTGVNFMQKMNTKGIYPFY